ncbi:MAG: MurT ligase domain-containing protein [Lachnospiraceae bacterium]
MKTVLTIITCKLLRFVGKIIGKGSSLPGKIALRICPDILQRIFLPSYIIAVTGSNGKTSTVEMIAHILTANGKKVAWNREGSNQIEGVTTLVLDSCTLGGKVTADILLIESDERFARYTFRYITPTHYVITNLYRDQLTRNGHPEWVYDALADSIHDETQLILNADDPYVSCFGYGKKNVVWFGVGELSTDTTEFVGVYHDGAYCPHCKQPMTYTGYHYNHIGFYHCEHCGHQRNETAYTVTSADLEKGTAVINGRYEIKLALKSLYNIYNILAAFTVASLTGIEGERIVPHLNNYVLKNGRVVTFTLGNRRGTLLTSKHENSISYNQSIRLAAEDKEGCDVLVIVDAISRKYFTGDVSWLWDIDFHLLDKDNVKRIILAGTYCNDLAVRFSYTHIPQDKIIVLDTVEKAVAALDNDCKEKIYVITCFSDKDKFLTRVKTE